jgi:hypothetical protein
VGNQVLPDYIATENNNFEIVAEKVGFNMLLGKLLEGIKGFSFEQSLFDLEAVEHNKTARWVLNREIGVKFCWSLMVSLFGWTKSNESIGEEGEFEEYSPVDYREIGKKLAHAVLEFLIFYGDAQLKKLEEIRGELN